MKKNLTLALLSALTIAGGSWLAAQQDEPAPAQESRQPSSESPSRPREASNIAEGARASRNRGGDRAAASPAQSRAGQQPSNDLNRNQFPNGGPSPTVLPRYAAPQFAPQSGESFGATWTTYPNAVHYDTPMSQEDVARMREFQAAIRELREAKDDEEKKEARDKVTQLVSDQLDADLANREEELAAIEQRAKELRKQLDERKTAKPELLKMLIMLVENPQVGLGIPPEWMQMLMRGSNSGFPSTLGPGIPPGGGSQVFYQYGAGAPSMPAPALPPSALPAFGTTAPASPRPPRE